MERSLLHCLGSWAAESLHIAPVLPDWESLASMEWRPARLVRVPWAEGLALLHDDPLLTALLHVFSSRPQWSVTWFCSIWIHRLTSIGRRSLRR